MGDWVVGEYVSRCCRGNWRMLRGLVRDRDRDGSQIGREFVCQKASPDLGGQGVLCQLWRVARMGACGRGQPFARWLSLAAFCPRFIRPGAVGSHWEPTRSPLHILQSLSLSTITGPLQVAISIPYPKGRLHPPHSVHRAYNDVLSLYSSIHTAYSSIL